MQDDSTSSSNFFLKTYIDFKTSFLNPLNWIIDFQCTDHIFKMNAEAKFYLTLQIYTIMPFILLIANVIFWTLPMFYTAICNKQVGGNRSNCKQLINRVALSLGICLFLIYPSITGFLLQSTRCFQSIRGGTEVDEVVQRLRVAPDIICSDSKFILHLFVFVLPGLLLYNVVIPILAICYMRKYAKAMFVSGTKSTDDQQIQERNIINDAKSYFGFFFAGLNLSATPASPIERK